MLLSARTLEYVEALRRQGDKFDYWKWLQRVSEEDGQASHVAAVPSSDESVVSGLVNPIKMPGNGDPQTSPTLPRIAKVASVPRPLFRANHKAIADTPETRLRRRLEKVCDAWDEFQTSRARDAVYPYLAAVAGIVEHYKVRRKTKTLLRHACKFAGLPFDKDADPFTAVIRSTCDRSVDNKTISKWARALRYVAYCKVPRGRLKAFMKEAGGVNACAARYARYYGRGGR